MVPDTPRATPSNAPQLGDFIRDERTPMPLQTQTPEPVKVAQVESAVPIASGAPEKVELSTTTLIKSGNVAFYIDKGAFSENDLDRIVAQFEHTAQVYTNVFGNALRSEPRLVWVTDTKNDPLNTGGSGTYYSSKNRLLEKDVHENIFFDTESWEGRDGRFEHAVACEMGHAWGYPDLPLVIQEGPYEQRQLAGWLNKDELFMARVIAAENNPFIWTFAGETDKRFPGVFKEIARLVRNNPGMTEQELILAVEGGYSGFGAWLEDVNRLPTELETSSPVLAKSGQMAGFEGALSTYMEDGDYMAYEGDFPRHFTWLDTKVASCQLTTGRWKVFKKVENVS